MDVNSSAAIESILDTCTVIAVVGLSSNPARVSHAVSSYMRSNGYTIIPVNPNETSVLGQRAYSRLIEIPQKVDLVNVFRRSEDVGAHIDEAIDIHARAVWMQEGVIDHAAAKKALDAGLMVVMDRCILKEHLSHRGR